LDGTDVKTRDFIKALEADSARPRLASGIIWPLAGGAAVLIAAVVFFATIGPRSDIGDAMETLRVQFKFVYTLALAASALPIVLASTRPDSSLWHLAPWLLVAPLLLAGAVAAELIAVPSQGWAVRLVGKNWFYCMMLIPLIGIGPLAIFLATLRHGAPTRPIFSGAVAGLLASGLAAAFYAAHCTDDSPLFVAVWYTIGFAVLTGLGALGGRLFLRW
jgi:hypothetical protein